MELFEKIELREHVYPIKMFFKESLLAKLAAYADYAAHQTEKNIQMQDIVETVIQEFLNKEIKSKKSNFTFDEEKKNQYTEKISKNRRKKIGATQKEIE
jgi:hypothetical protein